jgi:hypothetical protein
MRTTNASFHDALDVDVALVASQAPRVCAPRAPRRCTDGPGDGLPGAACSGLRIRDLELLFFVSLDEEYVNLRLRYASISFDLACRAHHYLLLTLARERAGDQASGLPETSRGWVRGEWLARDPSMAPPQLNLHVYRIRRQFAAAGVLDAVHIIERRQSSGQLRIGTTNVSITRT